MLSSRQKKAVRLMFHLPDDEVAARVGVMPRTVARWRTLPKFCEALASEERAVRAAAARIASDASLRAAKKLHEMLSNGNDGKLSLDTLKASGAFEEREESAEDTLEAMIRRACDETPD